MKVADVMTVDIVTVVPSVRYKNLWTSLIKKKIHSLPVVDREKKLLGIITEEDLLKPLYPDYSHFVEDFLSAARFEEMEEKMKDLISLRAEHLMSKKVIFARPHTPILRALSRMIIRNVRQLPVVSEENQLVGVVTKGDIVGALIKRNLSLIRRSRHHTLSRFPRRKK